MITADYHVHTSFSSDSKSEMEEMILGAIALGFDRVCITDHMDYDFPDKYKLPFVFDPDAYFTRLDELEKKYRDKIKLLKGIELGLRPYLSDRYETLITSYPFDFVIGSSHLANDMDPYQSEYWADITEEEGHRIYFQSIVDNIKSYQNFDVYGHLDYVIRYGPTKNQNYRYQMYQDLLDEALNLLIASDKGIELNTAGFKYGLGQPHPHPDLIKRYLELGGNTITIGSDGHRPEHMAYDFDKARELLLSFGVTHYTVFEKREKIILPL